MGLLPPPPVPLCPCKETASPLRSCTVFFKVMWKDSVILLFSSRHWRSWFHKLTTQGLLSQNTRPWYSKEGGRSLWWASTANTGCSVPSTNSSSKNVIRLCEIAGSVSSWKLMLSIINLLVCVVFFVCGVSPTIAVHMAFHQFWVALLHHSHHLIWMHVADTVQTVLTRCCLDHLVCCMVAVYATVWCLCGAPTWVFVTSVLWPFPGYSTQGCVCHPSPVLAVSSVCSWGCVWSMPVPSMHHWHQLCVPPMPLQCAGRLL